MICNIEIRAKIICHYKKKLKTVLKKLLNDKKYNHFTINKNLAFNK